MELSALTQEPLPQYLMLDSRNDADGVFLNITICLYNDIDLGSKSLVLLHDDGSFKERVSFRSLSPRKYLLE